jgi:carotenoid cleavage dioxygenase
MNDTSELESLRNELGMLRDAAAIRNLQHSYGYFMDKGLYQEVVDLFTDDGELHFMGGVFIGKAGLERLYCGRLREGFTHGINGPAYGMICEHIQLQDVIHVADDRRSARARFRALLIGGSHVTKTDRNPRLPLQWWEGGLYENEYRCEDGVWKIRILGHHLTFQANYEEGWAHSAVTSGTLWTKPYPEDPQGPDRIVETPFKPWPETPLVPFHYRHPVTGKEIVPETPTV